MSLQTTSPLTNKSTHAPLNAVEVPMTSHLIAISLSTLSAMKPKYATFLCLFPLTWTISLTTFNRRTLLLMLMFAVVYLSFPVALTAPAMAKLLMLAIIRSTSSPTRRRTQRNPILLDLGKPKLTRVTSAPLARNTTSLMSVTYISSAIDTRLPAITLPVLHLLLHAQTTLFLIMST